MATHRLAEAVADMAASVVGGTGRALPAREDMVQGASDALEWIEERGDLWGPQADEQIQYLHELGMQVSYRMLPRSNVLDAIYWAEKYLTYARQIFIRETPPNR